MDAVAHRQRATAVGEVGGITKRRVRAETDIAEIDLILSAESGDRSGEALRLVELQGAGIAGELHRIRGGGANLEARGRGDRNRVGHDESTARDLEHRTVAIRSTLGGSA